MGNYPRLQTGNHKILTHPRNNIKKYLDISKFYFILAMQNEKKERNEDRRKMLRQTHEAIKLLPDEKLKEYRDNLQRDANIKFR